MDLEKDTLLREAANFIRVWTTTQNADFAQTIAEAMDAAVGESDHSDRSPLESSGRLMSGNTSGEVNQPEWVGAWTLLSDRYPAVGEPLVVAGTLTWKSGTHTGFGRYGIKGGRFPGIGYLGDSHDWFCSPQGLQVRAWMPFPKAPAPLIAGSSLKFP